MATGKTNNKSSTKAVKFPPELSNKLRIKLKKEK